MRKSRFSESQIVAILREADAGMKVAELCRKHSISDATYYKWKRNGPRFLDRDLSGISARVMPRSAWSFCRNTPHPVCVGSAPYDDAAYCRT